MSPHVVRIDGIDYPANAESIVNLYGDALEAKSGESGAGKVLYIEASDGACSIVFITPSTPVTLRTTRPVLDVLGIPAASIRRLDDE